MSHIEERLRTALSARAELVRPEDLTLDPVYEPAAPQTGSWRQRPSSFLLVAAVAVVMIALPLVVLVLAGPDGEDQDPARIGTSPTDTATVTDPVLPPADRARADVDGDGALDDIRVVAMDPNAALSLHTIEVDLSANGVTETYDAGRAADVLIGATANVDGRRGEEVIAVIDPQSVDLHRATPIVLSLRDGRLAEILADELPGGDPGTLTYWWVRGATSELWWWRSQQPQEPGESAAYPVEVLRFPREDTLRGVPGGTWCVTGTQPNQLRACDGTE